MQINADKVKELIEESSQVIIMSHTNLDLDALGSSLGLYYLCKTIGKNASLLIDDDNHETGVARSLREIKRQKIYVKIRKYSEIEKTIDKETLLIIVDTNASNLLQNKNLLKTKNIIVIDHHIKNNENVIQPKYEYISEEQSSAVEIIIEFIKTFRYLHSSLYSYNNVSWYFRRHK
ncbi:MAG: DHH family phosphoesterase [Bacilli bacterium]|nr:DHH family phosphoesterase [Bacilli bacterium]